MSPLTAEAPVAPGRRLLVTPESKQKPTIVDLLNDWQYLEKATHRLICAWGRGIAPWFDKSIIHRHIWDQAEVVRRLREGYEFFSTLSQRKKDAAAAVAA